MQKKKKMFFRTLKYVILTWEEIEVSLYVQLNTVEIPPR